MLPLCRAFSLANLESITIADDESSLAVAVHERVPKGMPPIAWHSCSREEDMGSCIPKATDEPDHPATPEEQRHTRHGYYAAVSYSDDRVGQVLAELSSSNFAENTIVSINGDHGADSTNPDCSALESVCIYHRLCTTADALEVGRLAAW